MEVRIFNQGQFAGDMQGKKESVGERVRSLINMLSSKDGVIRQKARNSLVTMGRPAVSSLIRALRHSGSVQVRWEAAKALGAIGDNRSIPALVNTLTDSNFDVAWVAAEALRKFKKAAWPELMRALMKNIPDSGLLYQGAHHVLRGQREEGYEASLYTLMQALEGSRLSESTIVAAHEILERLKAEA